MLVVAVEAGGRVRVALRRELAVRARLVVRDLPTQQELAAMIGTSRETVSRAFGELGRRGLVRLSGRRLVLSPSFLAGSGPDR